MENGEDKKIVIVEQINAEDFIYSLYMKTLTEQLPMVDVIVTSPPYNLNVKYQEYKDFLDFDDYLFLLIDSFSGVDKISNENALMYINLKEGSTDALNRRIGFTKFFKSLVDMTEWEYVQRLIWFMPNKQIISPMNNMRLYGTYTEDVFFFVKKTHFNNGNEIINKSNIGIPLSDSYLKDKRYEKSRERMLSKYGKLFKDIGDMWVIPIYKYNKNLKKYNPAEFPIEFPEMAIKSHPEFGKKRLTVLDMFGGGGTTAIAGLRNDCNVYICDVSSEYIELTLERIRGEFDESDFIIYKIH